MIVLLFALVSSDQNIIGVVKDAAGEPVAGARITVSAWTVEKAASATTDAAGRYSLPIPEGLAANLGTGAAVAFHPEHGFAVRMLYNADISDFVLRFEKATPARIEFLDAAGKPLANATVAAVSIDREYITPAEFLAEATARTSSDGVAEFKSLSREKIAQLAIEISPGVTQSFRAAAGLRGWRNVKLSPMKPVRGRFVGAALPKGKEIVVETYSPTNRTNMSPVHVESRVKVAEDGSFTAMSLAEGKWKPKIDGDALWIDGGYRTIAADDGEVEWTLRPTTPVTGVVRDDKGAPLSNMLVNFYTSTTAGKRMTTDEKGRYAGRLPQGRMSRNVMASSEFKQKWEGPNAVEVPASDKAVELKPVVLERAATVAGVVTDEAGKPAAGVRVMAVCWHGSSGTTTYPTTRSQADGAFRIVGVPDGAKVTMHAFELVRGFYAGEVETHPNAADVKLKLDPASTATLSVTATDEAGRAIESLELRADVQGMNDDNAYWLRSLRPELEGALLFSGEKTAKLGAVPKNLRYQVSAQAPGFSSAVTGWVSGADLNSPIALTMRRVVQLAGRVVDSAGKPLSGVMVKPAGAYRSSAHSMTDPDGRFQIVGFPSRHAVLTAHKKGWRYGGAVIKDGAETTITLRTANEPAPRPMATEFPRAKETAEIAKRLSDSLADHVFGPKGSSKGWWAQSYAYMNPSKMLELIAAEHWSASDRDFTRHHLAAALAATDVDEAIAQAQAIGDGSRKAGALLEVAKRLPDSEKDRRRAVLANALTAARSDDDPAMKTVRIANIGEALWKVGDANGEKAIREAKDLSAKLKGEGFAAYAVGSTAESLSLIDFAAAMEMTKDLGGHDGEIRKKVGGGPDTISFNRHRGNIAHKIAGLQPANAEAAWKSLNDQTRSDQYAVRVCYRMAPVDLPRARRIGATIREPGDKATCLAVMAMALGPTRKADALPMLRAAFNGLSTSTSRGPYGEGPHALAQLGFVAAVAPEEVDDFFWQAMAIPGRDERSGYASLDKELRRGGLGATALLCQRFSEEAAVALSASLRDEWAAIVGDLGDNRGNDEPTNLALAAILAAHTDAASDMLSRWPAPGSQGKQETADLARLRLHSILTANPHRRNERVLERYLRQWVIDKEDL